MENAVTESNKANNLLTRESKIITGIFFTVLTVSVYYWLVAVAYGSPASRFGALVNAALFAVLGIRFIPLWTESWNIAGRMENRRAEQSIDVTPSNETVINKITLLKIFLAFLVFDFCIILLIYILQLMSDNAAPFRESLEIWESIDSRHYLDIAKDWYFRAGDWNRLVQLVFLPGYPLMTRIVNILVGNVLYSGMIVSGLCFAGAGTIAYLLVRLDHSHRHALRVLKYLCILPGAFFFAAPMSESMFLLLSVCCIYFLRKKEWFYACITGGAAAFTRSLGLVLFIPALYEMIADEAETMPSVSCHGRDKKLSWAAKYGNLIFIPFGFGSYLLINYQVSGNPFQFLIYQKEHWHQSISFFFNTTAYQIDYAMGCIQGQNYHDLLALWLPNLFCIFAGLIIMLIAVRKLRPSYTAYFMAYYVIAIGATWLLSGPRYLLTLFPIPMALAVIGKKPWLDTILTIGLSVFLGMYAYMFVNHWNVW
ncbi:MAG: hypothetical protein ACOYEH_10175 [Caldicoprobacterales bacterium]|jgi:Gpi18-like mannosyltransferase